MALDQINASEIIVGHGETRSLIGYQSNTYIKTTDESGSPSSYQFMGTGSPITLSGTLETTQRHSLKLLFHNDVFITDDLGNQYNLVLKDVFEVLEKDANDVPTLVGRAPGGRFGG